MIKFRIIIKIWELNVPTVKPVKKVKNTKSFIKKTFQRYHNQTLQTGYPKKT